MRKLETGELALSQAFYSPARKSEKVEMIPSFSSTRFLTNIQIRLDGVEGNAAPILIAKLAPGTAFKFSGTDFGNKNVPDGKYKITAVGQYESGNESETAGKEFLVDGKAPELRIVTTPEYFSPDKDGIDDELRIGVKVGDPLGVAKSELILFRKLEKDPKGRPFSQTLSNYAGAGNRAFKTWNLPAGEIDTILSWNGKSDSGETVESANDYVLFLRSEDKAGNTSVASHPITVDVLVERLADGRLRIIINSITFGFDSAVLGEGSDRTLDRLITILGKFPDYKIHIVGHTDSRGNANYNLNLSADRARSVFQYFLEKDIARARLTTEGKGASELQITPEKVEDDFTTEENYRKNRRVEFFLKKDEKKP
ncbi:MAG: OmpA family protein [Spirochaetia bacterium]|nr:OmpA family protein [Spirochaetia bacterium]